MARDKGVLIVFDLVSTLTNAGPRYVQAFTEICVNTGHGVPDREEVMEMLGNKTLSEIIDHFAGPMPEADKAKFMGHCNQTCDALLTRPGWREELYPHVREAVEALHLRGATLGIYTGTREDAMDLQLKYHGLQGEFDPRYIRGKDNTRDAGKKNAVLKAEQLSDIVSTYRADQGSEAPVIVIGDSAADAAAAAKQGLYFVGFAVNDKKRKEMEGAGVAVIVKDFGELPDLVDRLMNPAANDNLPRLVPALTRKPKP
jgi:phosphoglycolate phosphatase-like HAD superfamily hydrolase